MIKRLFALLLCLVLAFSLAACGDSEEKETKRSTRKTKATEENAISRLEFVVDDFVGLDYTSEVATHKNIGNYTVKQPLTMYSSEYPAGTVCKQDPAPGTKLKYKGELTLYVSLGSSETVPTEQPDENA